MAKLLIPTRNRPKSLAGVLQYLSTFYPRQEVIVADGSSAKFQELNCKILKDESFDLSIDHRIYDENVSLFDRLIDVLETMADEFVIMGADDDYPVLEVLRKGEKFLAKHGEYATAMGSSVNLYYSETGRLYARLGFARTISSSTIERRVQGFANWSFSTTYAVTRRDVLIQRYKLAKEMFLANFYDFNVGILDCIGGKIKGYPTVGYFCTRNYHDSYVRPEDNLIYLREGGRVLKIMEKFTELFMGSGEMGSEEAAEVSKRLIRKRVAQLSGGRAHREDDFGNSSLFKRSEIVGQYLTFHELFKAETNFRKKLGDRLSFIVERVEENSRAAGRVSGENSESVDF